MNKEIIDIIPIKLNENLPRKENYFHISYEESQFTIEMITTMIKREINKYMNIDYDYLILLKDNIVIGVIDNE